MKKEMKCSFDNAGAEVFVTISGCITKTLSKESKCKICPEKIKINNETSLLHKEYFIITLWIMVFQLSLAVFGWL